MQKSEIVFSRKNSLIPHGTIERKITKKSAYPQNCRNLNESGLVMKKSLSGKIMQDSLLTDEVKVKSISPDVLMRYKCPERKMNKSSLSILNLKLSLNNEKEEPKKRNLLKVVNSKCEMRILGKIHEIERKSCGNYDGIEQLLAIFNQFAKDVGVFEAVFQKFSAIFTKIANVNAELTSKINELQEELDKMIKGSIEEVKKNLIANEPEKKHHPSNHIIKFPIEIKRKMQKSKTKPELKSDQTLFFNLNKDNPKKQIKKMGEKVKTLNNIPILPVNSIISYSKSAEGKDYYDEFMENYDDFSESWRKLIDDGKRF